MSEYEEWIDSMSQLVQAIIAREIEAALTKTGESSKVCISLEMLARECDKARLEEVQNYLLDERDNHKHDLSYGYDRLAQLKAEAAQKGADNGRL